MDEVTNVEIFFKSHQVHVSRIWLESCIEWCKDESLPPNYSLKDLQRNVFEQWLLLDLRDLEVPCLPLNVSAKEKFILTDNYTLQLMQIIDISKPKYWQLQRIRNGIPKNLDQEIENTKRVLQLTLTDGVQEVEAMEYKLIKCLNINLSPGIKIRLMGPIQVRRGRLMLEEQHVKVFGGEVDSLLVSNAAENILAKHLNQPLNPKPEIIQESLLTVNKDTNNETLDNNKTTQLSKNIFNNPGHTGMVNNRINELKFVSSTPKPVDNNLYSSSKNSLPKPIEHMEDFDDRFNLDEEIETLMEVEREFELNESIKNKVPDMLDDNDLDFENIEIPNPSTSKVSSVNNQESACTVTNNRETKNFIDIINKREKPKDVSSLTSPPPVIWSIEKLLNTMPNITSGKFKIKARFKTIKEKMCVVDNNFHLVVEVDDATGSISLKFHSNVVTELNGYSPEEFMKLREEWSKNNTEAKIKALGALSSLKDRLMDLDNVLEVSINAKESFPILLKIM